MLLYLLTMVAFDSSNTAGEHMTSENEDEK